MPVVDVLNQKGEKIDSIELDDMIFNTEVKEGLVHQVVVWQQARKRQGTAATKTRGQIRGGGKKPWRQKGTGRARAGTSRSPVWRGGGTVFGPHPRSYAFSIPKKARKVALRSVLTSKLQENNLTVVDKIELPEPKTKLFVQVCKDMGLTETKALFVTSEKDQVLDRSSRNLYRVQMLPCEGLNVRDVLRFEKLVILQDAVAKIHERLG
jgi:large subunit ribosomal protein L4